MLNILDWFERYPDIVKNITRLNHTEGERLDD